MTFLDRHPELAGLPAEIREGMEYLEAAGDVLQEHGERMMTFMEHQKLTRDPRLWRDDKWMRTAKEMLKALNATAKRWSDRMIAIAMLSGSEHKNATPLECDSVLFGLAKLGLHTHDFCEHYNLAFTPPLDTPRKDGEAWGRIVENLVKMDSSEMVKWVNYTADAVQEASERLVTRATRGASADA